MKKYQPITCLNNSYKLPTGLVANYMRGQLVENNIWDQRQLDAV